ncbi:MAG TPA: nitronate monooxygenase [Kineosporiaceae bacterium]|nr:nitronate monooxygenase [Kineosporiaceae bacterium]
MKSPFSNLGVTLPVLAAPMAGGPSTPNLVAAAARVGGLGFVPGGYVSTADLAERIDQTRSQTDAFGVNLFVPQPLPIEAAAFRDYAWMLQPEADRYGIDLRGLDPVEDDDEWATKVDLLLSQPVPVVSFTFGLPDPGTIAALRRAGTLTVQTVTSPDEARSAQAAGVEVLIVQASAAGAHSGSFTPQRLVERPITALVTAVRAVTSLPLIAAGGLSTPEKVAAVLSAGADAVLVGTALLRADESGTSAVHRSALAAARGPTVLTRAFTGRPARALPNQFTERYSDHAPFGFPAIHHLTIGLRRAAAAAGDGERVHLWAGTGYRDAVDGPAGAILTELAAKAD